MTSAPNLHFDDQVINLALSLPSQSLPSIEQCLKNTGPRIVAYSSEQFGPQPFESGPSFRGFRESSK